MSVVVNSNIDPEDLSNISNISIEDVERTSETESIQLVNDPTFIKGIFVLIFVAFLLTIFEMVFFKTIIEPLEKFYILKFLSNLKNIKSLVNKLKPPDPYLKILQKKEEDLNNMINLQNMLFIVILIVFLFFILIYLFIRLKKISRKRPDIGGIGSSILSGLITIFVIGLFQILMFNFGRSFKYATSNEIQNMMNEKLEQSFNN